MVVIDTHLARGASNGGATFHAKGGPYGRTNGAKRVVAVDVTGLPLAALVVPASCTESAATELLLERLEANGQTHRLELVIVDRGTSAKAARALSARFGVEVRRIGWETNSPTFRPIAFAWRVEVAHGRLGRSRRLAKSFENTARSATGWLQAACLRGVLAASGHHPQSGPDSAVLSVPSGTMRCMATWRRESAEGAGVLVSHTGVPLTRPVAFRFALDVTGEQHELLLQHAGAARFAYNHHLARVRANLEQRRAEASYGIPREQQTPAVSWSKVSFINEFNAWKSGRASDSPINDDGSRGLPWRGEVSQDVFECASVNAAQGLANFSNSVTGVRKGKKAGFPRFKSRRTSTPAFKLRSKSQPGETAPVRVAGPKQLRFPTLGELRVHGSTRRVRRILAVGRLHLHGASFRYERGRWWVALQGVGAEFHPARRAVAGRHGHAAGLDVGVTALAVVADTSGEVLHRVEGVRAHQHAQQRLRRANQALARTKPGSGGRRKARDRLTRLHARIAHLRATTAHEVSKRLATTLTRLTVEDLNVTGMLANRSLARALSDAGLGDLHRLLAYKAGWYRCDLVEADRWYPSSKTCSACGQTKTDLTLSDRTYRCDGCGLELDRDVNAAINLARWPDQQAAAPPQAA